jgi:hypothetical protein
VSGRVAITSGHESTDDLSWTDNDGGDGITLDADDNTNDVITLTGTGTKDEYRDALRAVKYESSSDHPNTAKQATFTANDGDVDSNNAIADINVTRVNDKPAINLTNAPLAYSEGDGPVSIDTNVTVTDPETDQISGANIDVADANWVPAQDELAFGDNNNADAIVLGTDNDTTGTLTLTGNGTVAEYEAAIEAIFYTNNDDNPATAPRELSATVTDVPGATSNPDVRHINVARVNDAPLLSNAGTLSYTEGAGPTFITSTLTVADIDDTNLESARVAISMGQQSDDDLSWTDNDAGDGITLVTDDDTNDVITLTGSGTKDAYRDALRDVKYQNTGGNPTGPKKVTFRANDGDVNSNDAIADINITGDNDPPVVNLTDAPLPYQEGSGAVPIDTAVTVTDADSPTLLQATILVTTGWTAAQDDLAWADTDGPGGIELVNDDDSTGLLTLQGPGTPAQYEAAIEAVTYANNSENPSGDRVVSVTATDHLSLTGPADTRTISPFAVNDAPVLTSGGGSPTYTEGQGGAVTVDGGIDVQDVDDANIENAQVRISSGFQTGDTLTLDPNPHPAAGGISGTYNSGTGVLTLTGSKSLADYESALQDIAFSSTNPTPVTSKTVEFKVNDGDADSNLATTNISVTPVNSAPTVTAGGTTSYMENAAATQVSNSVTVDEPEDNQISGASATISLASYQSGQDFLSWTDTDATDGITIDNSASDDQTIVLTGLSDEGKYSAALRQVRYFNSSENPIAGDRTVVFSATDDQSPGATGSGSQTVTVAPVDDDPVAVDDPGGAVSASDTTVLEDAAATPIPVLNNDTDVDAGPKSIQSVTQPANGAVAITGGGSGLTYEPNANYCNTPPGTSPDTFTYTLNGTPGSTATVSMTVTCVNDAPAANPDTFDGTSSAVGNTALVGNAAGDGAPNPSHPKKTLPGTTGDILANDTDVDGPGPTKVVDTDGTPDGVDHRATADGGKVSIEEDGDFVYVSDPADSCANPSDQFQYTIRDSGSPEQTATGTVNVAITGCVWYVDNGGSGNSGTSTEPFDSLADAETASDPNDTVFVFDDAAAYSGGYSMNSGERLIGEDQGLTVGSDNLHAANAGAKPTLTASGEDVIDLDDGNTVRGFEIDPSGAGGGIAGSSGDSGGGTIADVNILDGGTAATQPALELDSTTGTFNFSNLVVNSNSTGVRLHNTTTPANAVSTAFAPTGQISITTNGAPGLDVDGTVAVPVNLGTSAFDDITTTGSSSGGVNVRNASSSTLSLGDGSGTDLSLTTTSGTAPAFELNNAGSGVSVGAGGSDNVSATGGPAIDVSGTTNPVLGFDDVDSTNSANDGINLDGLGSGTFTANSLSTIGNAAGTAFDVNGGSGSVDFDGAITNGDGVTADITNRTGDTSLDGPITDAGDADAAADTAISISGNNGGSTSLTAANLALNTGEDNAIVMSASPNHALTLSGGGLAITTTSGQGLAATGSGTLNVTGSGNVITTGSGKGLNVTSTNVGAAPLTFQSISGNGANAGILLSNTGSNAALNVTGNGGTCTNANTGGCSGGQIQGTTGGDDSGATPPGTGIVLNNTRGVSFTRMHIHDHSNYGIRGTSVVNFALANSVINGTNGTSETNDDSSVRMDNLTGSASVANTHVSGGFEDNFTVNNDSGTLNRITFDTVNVGANSTTNGNDGIQVEGVGSSTVNATVQNSTFTSSRADLFQMNADGTGGGDLDFISNTLSNNHPGIGTGGGGVSIFGGEDALFDVDMTGTNTFRDSVGHALLFVKSPGAGDINVTVDGAKIGVAGTANSGSLEGDGIKFQHAGGGAGADATLTLTNTQIRQYNNFGVDLQAGAGIASAGTINATVTGNTVANPGTNASIGGPFQGIGLNNGVTPGDTFATCAHIASNTAPGSGRNGGSDIRVRQRQSTTVRLPGYVGGATDTGAVNTFLSGQNSGASVTSLADSTGFAGGAPCPQ